MEEIRRQVVGIDQEVPTLRGLQRYVNFDNAASTPPFTAVMERIHREAVWYASIHRGTGYKSQYSTAMYEAARHQVARFVEADAEDIVIFTKNTTDSINKLSHYLPYLPGKYVVYSGIEHHSNELPWTTKVATLQIGLNTAGELDLDQAETILRVQRGNIKLLAVSAASNVTGYTPPVHALAEMVHDAGGRILVDGAQWVPHRQVRMYPASDRRHLDFLAFSAHKIYAPFGAGVLIGPRDIFKVGPPSQVGGGTIRNLLPSGPIWVDPPEVEEAGSPNVLGVLALVESLRTMESIGWDNLHRHEQELVTYALEQLGKIPGLVLYNKKTNPRVGVITFNILGFDHQRIASYLADEWGIGVRNGCFCARGYVRELLSRGPGEFLSAHPGGQPGMVRISFGCYNEPAEIDRLCEALWELNGPITPREDPSPFQR